MMSKTATIICMRDLVSSRFFFAHKQVVEPFRCFPTVLFMDAIYKTNRYYLSLLEVATIANNNNTDHVCAAFMTKETTGAGIVANSLLLIHVWHVLQVIPVPNAWLNSIKSILYSFLCLYGLVLPGILYALLGS